MRLRLIEDSINKTVNNYKERRVEARKFEERALRVVQCLLCKMKEGENAREGEKQDEIR